MPSTRPSTATAGTRSGRRSRVRATAVRVGPTVGEIHRPSDGRVRRTVVFIQCVGSRDPKNGVPYCSRVCCMYTPSRPSSTGTRSRTATPMSSTWTSARPGRDTKSSSRRHGGGARLYIRGRSEPGERERTGGCGCSAWTRSPASRARSGPTWWSSRPRWSHRRTTSLPARSAPPTTRTASSRRPTQAPPRRDRHRRGCFWPGPLSRPRTPRHRDAGVRRRQHRRSRSCRGRCSIASRRSPGSTRRPATAASTARSSARTARSSTRRSAPVTGSSSGP